MERFLTLFFLTIIVLAGSIFGLRAFSGNNQVKQVTPVASSPQTASITSAPLSFIPEKLIVEKLGINATVESVGMDQEGRMDVPKDADNVAWYNLGYKPGDIGSAVLAGHFDKTDGSPAVFYDLTDLKIGDTIKVIKDTNTLVFEVVETQTFDAQNFPMKRVFERPTGIYLNLITCDGVFDKTKKSYTKRYVVFSKLKTN